MSPDEDRLSDEFERRIREQSQRMHKARQENESSLWRYLGLLGMVGWSVAVPMALGGLAGWWIDAETDSGRPWTLFLLLVGLAVGCFNAWRSITRERD